MLKYTYRWALCACKHFLTMRTPLFGSKKTLPYINLKQDRQLAIDSIIKYKSLDNKQQEKMPPTTSVIQTITLKDLAKHRLPQRAPYTIITVHPPGLTPSITIPLLNYAMLDNSSTAAWMLATTDSSTTSHNLSKHIEFVDPLTLTTDSLKSANTILLRTSILDSYLKSKPKIHKHKRLSNSIIWEKMIKKIGTFIKQQQKTIKNLTSITQAQSMPTINNTNSTSKATKQNQADIHHLPLVSIIIRFHGNRLFWLRESIASAIQQTYANLEIIVIEDGGNHAKGFVDNISDTLRSPSLSVQYYAIPPSGRSTGGNIGLEKMSGEYFLFLDCDDLLYPNHITTLMLTLIKHPDADIAYNQAWRVSLKARKRDDISKGYIEKRYWAPEHLAQLFSNSSLEQANLMPIQAALVKSTVYRKSGGFNTKLDALEDWDLWLKYSLNHTFIFTPSITSLYHVPHSIIDASKRAHILHLTKKTVLQLHQERKHS